MASTKALFQPIQVGNIMLKNRIGMSSLTRNRAENTYPTDLMKEYYVQRATAGLIISEAILVTRLGTEWPHAPGLWHDKHVMFRDGRISSMTYMKQVLWHVGRVAHPDAPQQRLAGVPVYGPSEIGARGGKFRHIEGVPGYVTPTAIDDPWIIVKQFRDAAVLAKKAVFDGIQIHAGNGYIINQFLDNTANARTDEWGGSIVNRCRLALEITKAVIEIWGPDVSLKLSPTGGYNDMGMPLKDTLATFSHLFLELDQLNIAFIELVRYAAKHEVDYDGVPRSTKHDVLESYKPFIKKTKLFLNSDISPEEGERLVASGKVDGIFIGFDFITHSDLVKRVLYGKPLNNTPDIPHLQTNKTSTDWRTGYTDYPLAFPDHKL